MEVKNDDAAEKRLQAFKQLKLACLSKEDLSRKGSIDEPIRPLVELINHSPFYYTTSTCSGRITLIKKPYGESGIKKGSVFCLNSHTQVDFEEFRQAVSSSIANSQSELELECLWLKFEPFIMHIQCLSLDKARHLLNIALSAGCRNSGITLGKPDKFMLAIRSTSSMEIPLHCGAKFNPLEDSYLKFLHEESSRRLSDNHKRLLKFLEAVERQQEPDSAVGFEPSV